MPYVSVVIPAYNAESTLEKTLKDVLAQTFEDLEVVVVDDGSEDGTKIIAEKAATIDSRVRVIRQANEGMSRARNNGTIAASGEYILYVDSDDRIESYCLEYLVRALEESGADCACGGIDRVKEGFELREGSRLFAYEVFNQKETMQEMLTGKKLKVGPCCRLIPRKLMLETPFLDGKYYEDLSHTYRINLKINRVAFVSENLYHYVMRGGSITGRKHPTRKQCLDYYEAITLCASGTLAVYPELKKDADVLIMRDYMSQYLTIRRCVEKDSVLESIESSTVAWGKKHWKIVFGNKKAPVGVRLRAALFGLSPTIYEKTYYVGVLLKGKAIN